MRKPQWQRYQSTPGPLSTVGEEEPAPTVEKPRITGGSTLLRHRSMNFQGSRGESMQF